MLYAFILSPLQTTSPIHFIFFSILPL
jgi:hypothetical protein